MADPTFNMTSEHQGFRRPSLREARIVWIAIVLIWLGAVPGMAQLGRLNTGTQAGLTTGSIEGCAWQPGFHGLGPNAEVTSSAIFDDGTGAALYIGGEFRDVEGVVSPGLAKWDGTSWQSPDIGIAVENLDAIRSMAAYDDGKGEALYFTMEEVDHFVKWDGQTAETIPPLTKRSPFSTAQMIAFDGGSGSKLLVLGVLELNGVDISSATWDGKTWQDASFEDVFSNGGTFYDLVVFDDGTGAAVYAAGHFEAKSGGFFQIARWDGTSWAPYAAPGFARSLAVFDDGSGPALFAGGNFVDGGQHYLLAKILGTENVSYLALSPPTPAGTPRYIYTLSAMGSELHVGGWFIELDGTAAFGAARWNGSAWTALGTGVTSDRNDPIDSIVFDDGSGPAIYMSGSFDRAGESGAKYLARWQNDTWSAVVGSPANAAGTNYRIYAFANFDDGSGEALYATGEFSHAGPLATRNIAKWDGQSWHPLRTGINGPGYALGVHDDGTGPALYVGGWFSRADGVVVSNLAKWDGKAWHDVGGGTDRPVLALQSYQDGEQTLLFAGGAFDTAGGQISEGVARWDGSSWIPTTHAGFTNETFSDFEVFDDGSGPALFAGTNVSVFKWEGESFGTELGNLGGGSLAAYDDGTGPKLYSSAGGLSRWDGSEWVNLGLAPGFAAIGVYDDGQGRSLFALTGSLSSGRWDGTEWQSSFGSGITPRDLPQALGFFDDGTGPAVFVGGRFHEHLSLDPYATFPSMNFAKHQCPHVHLMSDGFETGDLRYWSSTF